MAKHILVEDIVHRVAKTQSKNMNMTLMKYIDHLVKSDAVNIPIGDIWSDSFSDEKRETFDNELDEIQALI